LKNHIITWLLIDIDTGEWIMRCPTREDARTLARGTDCIIAKVEVVR
jgi:hypothetical protein